MATINGFIHLPLPLKYVGRPKLRGGGNPGMQTKANLGDRGAHGTKMKQRVGELSRFWQARRAERVQLGLPDISANVPFLLEIDPTSDVEFLRGLGFEIVCSLDDGFIVVASEDAKLEKFVQKIEDFLNNKAKSGSPAKIYALSNDTDRLSRIISTGFKNTWDSLQEDTIYTVEIAISCGGTVSFPKRPDNPDRNYGESDTDYNKRLTEYNQRLTSWQAKFNEAYQKWDEIASERQATIMSFVSAYGGEIPTPFIDENDSFSFRLKIIGKGLRDFVLNYPYIFYVAEVAEIQMESSSKQLARRQDNLHIIPPEVGSPIICIIDSGVQEGHRYIAPAILTADSKSLIPNVTSVNDDVSGGGHGTRVAGAALYPNGIPATGDYHLPHFIRNIKVLDNTNSMPESVDPASVIINVADSFSSGTKSITPSKIYNQSVAERKPYTNLAYMSSWAAQMDKQSYENDMLFIQAAGNIIDDIIKSFIKAGHVYPEYLGKYHELSRLANPAQSLQAITVGSVSASHYETEDMIAMGNIGEVASFSRIGPGIWDTIKPDVVEFGGTHAINKIGDDIRLTQPPEVCPELIRKSPPGKAFDRDSIGTSFSAPKVSSIAAEIEKILPHSPSLLYRALIAQSARWPDVTAPRTAQECEDTLRRIGFGLPNAERATHNDEYRVTLITPAQVEIGEKEAHVYAIKVPDEMNAVGEDFDILLEVTLSYVANPRRTRRYIKGYLSTWVDWICSRKDENSNSFMKRIFNTGGSVDDSGNFDWMLGESRGIGQGKISDLSRSRGTLQKDWCIIKSNQLTDEFRIAVRGHKGWGSLFKAKYSLVVSFEAINQDIAIYEPIRIMNEVEIESNEISIEVTRQVDE